MQQPLLNQDEHFETDENFTKSEELILGPNSINGNYPTKGNMKF